jgi:alpha-N-arabinofuranosidase
MAVRTRLPTCDAWPLAVAAVTAVLCCGAAPAAALLGNPSFDDGQPDERGAPPGWEIAVYGAQPSVSLDAPAPGLPGRSLCIRSAEPSDTAIYQDLAVQPSGWYRLSAWVRTEDLKADTSIYGVICASLGPVPYACSPNLKGTNKWQQREIVFRAPASGALRVAMFFVGFGKGTGAVWFDGLRLEPISARAMSPERITVTNEKLREAPISPYIYGSFIEFLDHHVQGMRAQMLDDTSFEGLLPPADWCYWQRDKDTEDHPWFATEYGEAKAELIDEGAFNGARCYRLHVTPGAAGTAGIRQGGLAVKTGRKYTVSLYLRQEDLAGPVTVTLGRDYGAFVAAYAGTEFQSIASEWTRYSATLVPDTDDRDAELSIRISAPGALYIDRVTLTPEDNVRGWRRDVVEAVRELMPHCIRFGGSAVIFYDWKLGIGDPDRRVPFRNEPWGRMEPNDVGTDEFLQFCELVGAEPLLCVSYNVGGPEDAAAQVEYCNGSAETKWGRLRAENGHPAPYNVRLWQVGNEQQGPQYESRLADFCRAMRAADPTIEICSSFPTDAVVERAGDLLDYLSPHHYTPSLRAIAADILAQRERVERLGKGRPLRLAVTEWNHTAGDWGPGRALLGTQYNALYCARVLQLYQRNSDFVAIANRSNLTNSWWAGVVQTNRDSLFVTPAYYAMSLMSRYCGKWPLRVTDERGQEVSGSDFGSVLDAAASVSEDGSRLTLTVVNDGADAVETTLDLRAHVKSRRPATCHVLAADGQNEMNDFARPDHVKPTTERLRVGPTLQRRFPAWSLTVIVVELR